MFTIEGSGVAVGVGITILIEGVIGALIIALFLLYKKRGYTIIIIVTIYSGTLTSSS